MVRRCRRLPTSESPDTSVGRVIAWPARSGTTSSGGSRPRSTTTAITRGSGTPPLCVTPGRTSLVRVGDPMAVDWMNKHYTGVIAEALARSRPAGRGVLRSFRKAPRFLRVRAPDRGRSPATRSRTRSGIDDRADQAEHAASAASVRATRSKRSSSARRISLRMRPAARSPKRRRVRITRCSCTAAWDSARRI